MLLLLLACSGDEDPVPPPTLCDPMAEPVCSCAPTAIALGDGEEPFTTLVPGQEVTLWHGPQGGWHVLASVAVSNSSPFVILDYTIRTLPELAQVAYNVYNVQLPVWEGCEGQLTDIFGYLDTTAMAQGELNTPPELLAGRQLRLDMIVTDIAGLTAATTIDVVGKLDPMDEPGVGSDTGYDPPTDSGTGVDTGVGTGTGSAGRTR